MWDGRKPNGARAGGLVYKTICKQCGAALIAYGDLYDETGKLQQDVTFDSSGLRWGLDA